MDMKVTQEEESPALASEGGIFSVLLYGLISFLVVIILLLILYIACTKRYRLNWFERNLLETAETSELTTSQDALIIVCGEGERRGSRGEDNFWIPVGKQTASAQDTASDDWNGTASPSTTAQGSKHSLVLEEEGPQPIARNGKHVVLSATPPAKPLVSMNTKLDFTKIDTALYEQPEEVVVEQEEKQCGRVHISLSYDPTAEMLSVRLIEAQNLVPRDYSGTADPYAKIRLLPDRANVWQTRIHKKTLNPVFDEDFVFEARAQSLSRRTLEMVVYNFDAYARHQRLGDLKLPIGDTELREKLKMWQPLTLSAEHDEKAELGDLMVSISYLPSAERLTVVVMKARDLRVIDENKVTSDPFVKVTLLHGGKRLKKKKTSIHRNTICPTFNERLTFDVSKDLLSKCSLEMCVYHDSKLGPSELLGRCVVGSSSSCTPADREFFHELLTSKAANAKWLVLTDPR